MSKNSMVMYETYYDCWKQLNEIDDKYGKEFIDALFRYGLYGEIVEVSPIVKPIMSITNILVTKATDRYTAAVENGKKGGRPREHDYEIIAELHRQGLSVKEIAEKVGGKEDSIRKILKAQRDWVNNQKNQKNLNDNVNVNVNEYDNDNVSVNVNVNDNDKTKF